MYLLEVHLGLFADPFTVVADQHSGWHLITACDSNLTAVDARQRRIGYTLEHIASVCPLFYESGDFDDDDYDNFDVLLKKMLRFAAGGYAWKDMGDDVHDDGEVTVQRTNGKHEQQTIIQFGRKRTLLRIHAFTSGTGRKVAFISHTFVKPANVRKTPKSEQTRARANIQAYLGALDAGTAQLIDVQGGRDGFKKLV